MSASPTMLDPRVAELLHELARDPDSVFFRTATRTKRQAVAEAASPASLTTTGLSVIERELVQVHRAELAELLYEASYTALFDGPATCTYLNRYASRDDRGPELTPEALTERTRELAGLPTEGEDESNAFQLLSACVEALPGLGASPRDLALASCRLVPRNRARLLVAISLSVTGSERAALGLFERVSRSYPSEVEMACILEQVVAAELRLDRLDLAHAAARESSIRFPSRLVSQLNAVTVGTQAGDAGLVLDASGRLDAVALPEHAVFFTYAANCRAGFEAGTWTIKPGAKVLSLRLRGQVSQGTARVLEVFDV